MSDTDSDLAFESADEDAEFACTNDIEPNSEQESSGSKVSAKTICNDEKLSTETTEKLVVNKEHYQEVDKIEESVDNISQENTSEQVNRPPKEKSSKVVSDIKNEHEDESAVVLKDQSDNTACSAEVDNKQISSTDIVSANSDIKTIQSETAQEKKRVVLRLEKKIQQKQLSKETSVEKEKASDLINILRDQDDQKQTSSWGFSSWGTSLLSSAASSVSTFSNQVSQGIGTVLETVESTLGAPSPEELANILSEKKGEIVVGSDKEDTKDVTEAEAKGGLLPDVSSWFGDTGSKVLMGGLDTLELIGKKTMDILTEGDPGLRKKRAAFNDGAYLSQILREAKARADAQDQESSAEDSDTVHYSQIFDEKQGLVHLEALEILSKQNQANLQRLLMRHSKNTDVKKQLEEIRSICENIPSLDDQTECENFEDFETVFKKHTIELSFPLNVENIIRTQRQINDVINKYENMSEETNCSPKEVYHSAIYSLAELTAKCIETFHKVAELILVQPNLESNLEQCATNLTGLTTVMCIEISNLSSRFHKCLDAVADSKSNAGSESVDTTTMATNLYVEAANSNKYIQDAYQMLVPILHVCLLDRLN